MNEAWWFRLIVPLAFGIGSLIGLFQKVGFGILGDVIFLCLAMFLLGAIIREKEMESRK